MPFCFLKKKTKTPCFNNSICFISRKKAHPVFSSSSSACLSFFPQTSFDSCQTSRFSSERQPVISIFVFQFCCHFSCCSTIISNASSNSQSANFCFKLAFRQTKFFISVFTPDLKDSPSLRWEIYFFARIVDIKNADDWDSSLVATYILINRFNGYFRKINILTFFSVCIFAINLRLFRNSSLLLISGRISASSIKLFNVLSIPFFVITWSNTDVRLSIGS